MTPIQQLMLGTGSKKKVFLDEVFSTNVYVGAGSGQVINNGIDNSSEGGMVWFKRRDGTYDHQIVDTVRGGSQGVQPNTTSGTVNTQYISAFNTNGYTLGTESAASGSGDKFAAWNFRKAPGFFTIKKFVGNSSTNQTLTHDLGCVPGCIMIKSTSNTDQWTVYHRGAGQDKYLYLNESDAASSSGSPDWSNISSTSFEALGATSSNENGYEYIAYIFAGGESNASEARSVDFDGTGDYLNTSSSSSDFTMGTGDFTVECWVKMNNTNQMGFFQISDQSGGITTSNFQNTIAAGWAGAQYHMFGGNANSFDASSYPAAIGRWTHIAFVRSSGVSKLYVNGTPKISITDTTNYDGTYIAIGGYYQTTMNGEISNFRVVKGTAVYTSSFRPPTEPLANITNTKLLCCNDSSTTGSTVTPVTLNSQGDPTASTDSPFDDPAAHVFGESGSESVIKTGSFVGNGSSTGPEINLGWEPQWILTKNSSRSDNWMMFDSMRGIVSGDDDEALYPNLNNAKSDDWQHLDITPTGFKIKSNNGDINANGETTIFIAIRRSDGYCGKPIENATKCFAMDTGSSSSTIPNYDSGFPLDWAWYRKPASSFSWWSGQRLTGDKLMTFTGQNAEGSGGTDIAWDSNTGWSKDSSQGSDYQSWMFKRHAGFDVVTDTSAQWVRHSLNRVPEMVIIKDRIGANSWFVWHKDLNGGGSNSIGYFLALNSTAAQANWGAVCPIGNTLPTATHFETDSDSAVRNANCIAFLFATTDVSKVGSYSGSGSSGNAQNIGFQPRFLFVKRTDDSGAWYVFDSLRTTSNPFRYQLELNTSNQQDFINKVTVSSTGWSFTDSNINESGSSYVYYAHA